jgi:hypothetical protein
MSYSPPLIIGPKSLAGNPGSTPGPASGIPVDQTLVISGGKISAPIAPGRTVSTNASISATDHLTTIVSTSNSGINITLPAGLPDGCKARLLQAGNGAATFVAGAGATLVNEDTPTTAGQFKTADFEHLGGNQWIVTGDLL